MKLWRFLMASVVLVFVLESRDAWAEGNRSFNAREFGATGDGKTDDTAALARCFQAAAEAGGGTVTIPPGDYRLPGEQPIPLPSRTTVFAHGARFHLPQQFGDQALAVMFVGTDLHDFAWFGGHEETKITLGTNIGAQVAQPSSDAQFGNPQPAERASLRE